MERSESLDLVENHLRSGEVPRAQKLLRTLTISRFNFAEKVRAASLARRAGLASFSIKWLFEDIYRNTRLNSECEPELLLEYGAALVSVGALSEGRKILEILSKRNDPRAFLHLAFSYIKEWDYESSHDLLKKIY